MKRLFIFVLVLIITYPVFGATTLTHTSGSPFYQLNTLDSDYVFDYGMWIESIEFNPGAANEYVVLKYKTDTGERIVKLQSSDGEPRVKYFDGRYTVLMYDASESSVSSTAKIIVTRAQ